MLADKLRLGVGLSAINFLPRASDKRPSASFANDCWHPGVVAIIRLGHLGGRRLERTPWSDTAAESRVGPKSNMWTFPSSRRTSRQDPVRFAAHTPTPAESYKRILSARK